MITKEANFITDLLWDKNAGPAENILGLVETGYMFLGGTWGRIAAIAAHLFGLSLKGLGKHIDEMFHLNSLEDLANFIPEKHMVTSQQLPLSSNYKNAFKNFDSRTVDQRSALEILLGMGSKGYGTSSSGNLLGSLALIAKKIMTSGLIAFLTMKAVDKIHDHAAATGDETISHNVASAINKSKSNIEAEIRKTLGAG